MSLSGSGGSIASAFVEISANTQQFQQQLDSLISNLSRLTLTVQVDADTGQITVATERAVDNADTTADIDAETSGVSGQITSAVDNADSTVDVDADTAGVSGQIDTAVGNADGTFDVDADTAGVSGQITSAVDNADTSIDIDVESNLAAVRAELSTLQQSLAQSEAQTEELRQELDRLGKESEETTQGMSVGFRGVAAIVGGALAGSFAQAGIQFNELQQTSRAALTTLLDGAEAATAQLSELNAFASESPFPRQEFLRAQQTLISFGTAAEDVVPTLSAIQDALAASGQSGQQIGELAIIFGQIQSAGRITAEELNQFAERGVNAAQLIGDQMGLTAGEIREQISAGALDAETALRNLRIGMQEEFEGAAAGVRETFAGARDRVRAALRDISSDLFSTFVDPQGGGAAVDFFNDLADSIRLFSDEASASIGDAGSSLTPILQSLGQDLLPAVAVSLAQLTPLLGSTGTLAQAAVPVFQLLGAALEAVPPPALQAGAAFALLNRIDAGQALVDVAGFAQAAGRSLLETVSGAREAGGALTGVRGAARGVGSAIGSLAASIGPAGFATAGLAAGMVLLSQNQERAAQRAQEHRERVDTLREAMSETGSVAEGLELGLERLAEGGDASAEGIAAAGLSANEFREAVLGASTEQEAVISAFRRTDDAAGATDEQLRVLGRSVTDESNTWQQFTRNLSDWRGEADENIDVEAELGDASVSAAEHIETQVDALNELAEEQFAAAQLAGTLTDEQIEQVESAEFLAGAWFEVKEELEAAQAAEREQIDLSARQAQAAGQLTNAQFREIESTENLDEAQQLLNDSLEGTSDAGAVAAGILEEFTDAEGRTADQSRDVANALSDIDSILTFTRDAASDAGSSFIDLNTALEASGVDMRDVGSTSEALDFAMGNLALSIDAAGISGERLEEIAQGLGVNVNDLQFFVEQTAAVVNDFVADVESNIPTVSDALGELDELTLTGVRDSVLDTLDAINQFADDIDELSIRPAIQRLAIQEGPELANVLAEAQRNGNDAMLDEIEQGLIDVDNARQGLIDDARVFALEFAVSMGLIAEIGVEAFAEEFDIESPLLDQLNRTGDALSDAAISDIAGETGRTVTEKYGDGVSGMVPESARNSRAARAEFERELPAFASAGRADGDAAKIGFRQGLSALPGETGRTVDNAVFAVASRQGPGTGAGLTVGTSVKVGVDTGLSGVVGNTAREIDSANSAVRGRAGSARGAGGTLGSSVKSGVESGLSGVVGNVRKAALSAARAPDGAKATGFNSGFSVGSDIGQGMADGIGAKTGVIQSAAASAARAAESSAKAELAISSPSRVFRDIGEDVVAGFVLGLQDNSEVVRASNALAVSSLFDPQRFGGVSGGISRGGTRDAGPGGTVVQVQRGAIQIKADSNTSPEHVRRLTRAAEQGFNEALARRQVIVDSRTA